MYQYIKSKWTKSKLEHQYWKYIIDLKTEIQCPKVEGQNEL